MDRSKSGPGWLSLPAPALESIGDSEIAALPTAPVSYMKDRALAELEAQGIGFPFLRDSRWTLAFMRSWAILARQDAWLRSKNRTPLGDPSQLVSTAALVADYHAWKWADEGTKKEGLGVNDEGQPHLWPTLHAFITSWGIDLHQMNHALYESRYRKWEHRYAQSESRETRIERLRRRVHQDVEDMADVPVDKRNPKTYEVAAKLEGEPMGAKVPSITIGGKHTTNNLILPASISPEEIASRMKAALEAIAGKKESTPIPLAVEVPDEAQAG